MKKLLLLSCSLFFAIQASSQTPTLSETDRIRIAEAYRLAQAIQNDIWDDWDQAPFAILLITLDHEFLIGHPNPSDNFTKSEHDALLESDIYYRKRVLAPHFLATFPADNGLSTVVVGQAENTNKSSTPWVVTLLHEHFHQLQSAQPDQQAAVEALDLAGGDQTGMWMLNYPFPYDSTDVVRAATALQHAALAALESRGTATFSEKHASFLQAKDQLRAILPEKDYRYLSFQLWKEGISRYTEYHVARVAAQHHQPSAAFQALPDYLPYDEVAEEIEARILRELKENDLRERKRVAFYALGAAEGLLLDEANPEWRKQYFTDYFYLERYVRD